MTRSSDGRRTRWDAHRTERRHQIVEAALAVLAGSVPDFGVEEVAERAGVTKPVVYRHFTDRAGLVEAMGEQLTETLLEDWVLPAVRTEDTPPRDRIHGCISAFLGFVEHYPQAYRLFAHVPDQSAAHTSRDLISTAIYLVVGQYAWAGGADTEVVELWSHGVVGFVQNATDRWLEQDTVSRERLTDQLTDLIWAQIDGVARSHGFEIDPTVPVSPDDIARLRAGD